MSFNLLQGYLIYNCGVRIESNKAWNGQAKTTAIANYAL